MTNNKETEITTTNIPLAAAIQCEGCVLMDARISDTYPSRRVEFVFPLPESKYITIRRKFYGDALTVTPRQFARNMADLKILVKQILTETEAKEENKKAS